MKLKNALVIAILAVGVGYVQADDREIPYEKLPAKVKSFVSKNVSGQKVARVEEDGAIHKSYEVFFEDGHSVEFDRNGNWKEVDFEGSEVPASFVPAAIKKYVNANYRGKKIVKIQKDSREYEVKLSTGVELIFNKNGQFKRIDD